MNINKTISKNILIIVCILSFMSPIYSQNISREVSEAFWGEVISEARTYYEQRKYTEAADSAKKALKLAEEYFGSDSPHIVLTLNYLWQIYYAQGKYSEAEPFCKRALLMTEKNLGSSDKTVATLLSNLASTYYHQGKYNEAEPIFKRALDIERKVNPNNPDIAVILRNMKELYEKMGREEEVKKLEGSEK